MVYTYTSVQSSYQDYHCYFGTQVCCSYSAKLQDKKHIAINVSNLFLKNKSIVIKLERA